MRRLQVSRKHRPLLGLTRPEFDDEMKAEEAPGRETFHIGVVMIGLADRNHIRTSPRDRVAPGNSSEWRNEYGRRVDRFIKTLKKRGMAVYWVGQPVMRRPDGQRAGPGDERHRPREGLSQRRQVHRHPGAFCRRRRQLHALWARHHRQAAIAARGRRGAVHLLRLSQACAFSSSRRSSAICCRPRTSGRSPWPATRPSRSASIRSSRAPSPGDGTWKGTVSRRRTARRYSRKSPAQIREAPVADTSNDQRADNGRITLKSIGAGGREESVTIDILRPAIPSAVIALMTRKDTGDRPRRWATWSPTTSVAARRL